MTAARSLLAPAILVLVAAFVGTGTAAPTARCWTTGAPAKVGKKTTTRYLVEPHAVSCAFAKPWVTRLSYKRGARGSSALSGGPPGWLCFTSAPGERAAVGHCGPPTGPKSFDWSRSVG